MLPAQRLSVHTVSDQFEAFMPELLRSLEVQTFREYQILAVDNASPEGAGQLADHPQTAVLRNPRPQTWAKAQNQALALALGRWEDQSLSERAIVIASPQIVLAPEALARLAQAFDKDPALMIASPKILRARITLNADGESRDLDFGQTIISAGALMTRGRSLIWRGAGETASEKWSTDAEIFTPSPDVFMIRASALSALSKTGPWFDERLPPLSAVLDLAWRIRLWGGRAVCFGEALAWKQSLPETVGQALHSVPAVALACGLSDSPWVRLHHLPWIILERVKNLAHPSLWSPLLGSFGLNLARWSDRGKRLQGATVTRADMANWFV